MDTLEIYENTGKFASEFQFDYFNDISDDEDIDDGYKGSETLRSASNPGHIYMVVETDSNDIDVNVL